MNRTWNWLWIPRQNKGRLKPALGCVHTAAPFHGAHPGLACPTQNPHESRQRSDNVFFFRGFPSQMNGKQKAIGFWRAILCQNPSCEPTLRGNAHRADMLPIFCSGFVVENPQLLQEQQIGWDFKKSPLHAAEKNPCGNELVVRILSPQYVNFCCGISPLTSMGEVKIRNESLLLRILN